ncbi:MAG: NapC/NirT family cytochrome c [Azoarcus sp.]|jgi:cytochrome c-type protein NapC|nr:NapC/NirT family cytochrome c [Azoarcus sp.]
MKNIKKILCALWRIKLVGLWAVAGVFVLGILFWAGFNTMMNETNTEAFCISCHEMQSNYREYQDTVHHTNRSGVRATCPDCHVPQEFVPKMVAKVKASADLWHSILGSIDTPEKFNAKRQLLAEREWRRMQANNSQECRNCHDTNSFDYGVQSYRSADQHMEGLEKGQTCIDCHKGIAHQLPQINQGINAVGEKGVAPEIFHSAAPKK